MSENYLCKTDIFIHTNNKNLTTDQLHKNKNGKLVIIWYDLTYIDPHYLTWKCRDLMAIQSRANEYDVFMYIEDDILVPWSAIDYWLEYSPLLLSKNLNIGFLRIEKNLYNEEVITDIESQLREFKIINDEIFYINNINPYCAFWIYDKKEFARFVASELYDIKNILGGEYGIRESSAIGLHGLNTNWYQCTVLPWDNSKKRLHDGCKIYHMPNNYALNPETSFGKIKYEDAVVPHF